MKFYTPGSLAEILEVKTDTVRGLIKSGRLRAINFSSATTPRWRISQSDLDAFLAANGSCEFMEAVKAPVEKASKAPKVKNYF